MQKIDIQQELPPEGVEVFYTDEDGQKSVIEYLGKDNDERDLIYNGRTNCTYAKGMFVGHWIKEK